MPTLVLDRHDETEDDRSGKAALAEAHKRIGTTLRGKWRLERLIGIGGMGAVYEARHRNGMRGAVKVLDVALSRTKDCRERFLREGRVANEVAHVGAVRVLDDDETEDGSAFLVMELLAGATLDRLALDRGGTLAPDELLRYAAQVLDTLACAHERGIVHRDIKPENLLLTKEGIVKILDFGIARWNALGESHRVTQAGEPIGTPAFMPPEQARGHWRSVDAQSDLYSLGATLFTLVTGEPIHPDASTVAELLVAVITRPARPVKQAGEVPDVLAEIIDRALSYDKRGRFADALEMRAAVEAAHVALTGESIPATPIPSPVTLLAAGSSAHTLRARLATTIRRHRVRPIVLALAIPCAVAIAGACVAGTSSRTQAAEPPKTNGSQPQLTVATAPLVDIPPPPPAPLAVRDGDDAPQQTKASPAPATQGAPVTNGSISTTERESEPVIRASTTNRLSRRSSLYERRF